MCRVVDQALLWYTFGTRCLIPIDKLEPVDKTKGGASLANCMNLTSGVEITLAWRPAECKRPQLWNSLDLDASTW